MKILLQSCLFSPSVGGTETATLLVATGLVELGHEVKIVTRTPGSCPPKVKLEVHRNVTALEYLSLMRWCDVFVQSNISLRNLWPLAFFPRPWVIIHHTRIETDNVGQNFNNRVKQWAARFATNLAVSRSMAENLQAPSIVVKNPYADNVFKIQPGVREGDLIVVGRLNEDKGFQLAIEALYLLHQRGHGSIRLTIVGEGYYEAPLVALVKERKLEASVDFMGFKSPGELADTLNHHKILIVPSFALETFGLIAIEGIACGCLLIASDVGSLKETIGPCGLTFHPGNAGELSNLLEEHLDHPEINEPYVKSASTHLNQFTRSAIIPSYANHIQKVVSEWSKT